MKRSDEEKRLVELLNEKRVIAFIGSGVSKAALKELPTWQELFAELIKDSPRYEGLVKDSKNSGDWLRFFEIYQEEKGKDNLIKRIKELTDLKHPDILSSQYHVALMELPIRAYYTTNFDTLLEQAFEAANKPYNKIVTLEDIGRRDPVKYDIIKFHGDFSAKDTLVITEEKYHERLSFQNPLDILLKADALGKAIVFFGYSFSDPNVRYLFRGLKELGVGKKTPESFFIAPRLNEFEIKSLQLYGIKTFHFNVAEDYSDINKLYEFFGLLIENTRKGFFEREDERLFGGIPRPLLTKIRLRDLENVIDDTEIEIGGKIEYLRRILDLAYVPTNLYEEFISFIEKTLESNYPFELKENLGISLNHIGNPAFLLVFLVFTLKKSEVDFEEWHSLTSSAYYHTKDKVIAGHFLEIIVGYLDERKGDRGFVKSEHAERVFTYAQNYTHGLESYDEEKRKVIIDILEYFKENNPRIKNTPRFLRKTKHEIMDSLLSRLPKNLLHGD